MIILKRILVIGSSNVDLVIHVPYMPSVGETIKSSSFDRMYGGKGANQALACSKLGGNTSFLSVVGNDKQGDILVSNIRMAGVNADMIERVADAPTGMALIYINKKGNNSIVIVPGANEKCNVDYLKRQDKAIADSDIVILQMEIPSDSVYYAIKRAKELGKMIILNPAPAPENIPDGIYHMLDFITPNETELQKLTGLSIDSRGNLINAAKTLLNRGVSNVIVTLGSKGAMMLNKGGEKFFGVPKVNVVDTTAAGDTFNAAFAVKIAEGKNCDEAIRFANLASSITVSRAGAQPSIPSRQEVIEFSSSLIMSACPKGEDYEENKLTKP